MHVPIEQLYGFVMGEIDLTSAEQAHLVRCNFCVDWLDECVNEKISLLTLAKTGNANQTP
jgi:hypothetical protein